MFAMLPSTVRLCGQSCVKDDADDLSALCPSSSLRSSREVIEENSGPVGSGVWTPKHTASSFVVSQGWMILP